MSEARFQISYDGPAVERGSMDIHELGLALQAVGDLVLEANSVLNGKYATADVRVEADFKRGSFEISFLLDQNLLDITKDFLFSQRLSDAQTIIKLIFGGTTAATAAITGLFKLYKFLKGEKPEEVKSVDASTTIFHLGSGDIILQVDAKTAELYRDDKVHNAAKRLLRPLKHAGIESVELLDDGEVVEHLDRDDVGDLELELSKPSSAPSPRTSSREVLLKLASVSFEKSKWRFSDGGSSFAADVKDTAFLQKLDAREEGFYKGDLLRVQMTTVQDLSTGKLKATHSIDQVLEHIQTPTQLDLNRD